MFPLVNLPLLGISLSTSIFLDLCCLFAAPFALYAVFRRNISFLKLVAMALAVSLASWVGARLFHVVFERPQYFLAHPSEIFTRFDGMTFYGALGLGSTTLFLLVRLIVPKTLRGKMFDISAIFAAFTYGILRIGCFADGCCWGKLSRHSWAVRYFDQRSEMPYLGIPVHPVQLYDALAGFLIGTILVCLYRRTESLRGRLIWIFFILYSVARMITENFRGDSYRGVNLIFGMSTSQLISIFLIATAATAIRLTQMSNSEASSGGTGALYAN